MKTAMKFLMGLVLSSALVGGALAIELDGRTPYQGDSFGQQSDANSASYTQAFVAPANSILESIRWWGFHGLDSMGPSFDNFVVVLDGVVQSGSLTVTSASPYFDEYTLDIAGAALSATSLSILNNSFDVEWYWQSASALGNADAPDAKTVGFSLVGHSVAEVPEPSMFILMLCGIATLALGRSRRSRAMVMSKE